jgi:hypothetical protein
MVSICTANYDAMTVASESCLHRCIAQCSIASDPSIHLAIHLATYIAIQIAINAGNGFMGVEARTVTPLDSVNGVSLRG